MFKITHPAVVSLHACRSAGRGRGFLCYISREIVFVVILLIFLLGHTIHGKKTLSVTFSNVFLFRLLKGMRSDVTGRIKSLMPQFDCIANQTP